MIHVHFTALVHRIENLMIEVWSALGHDNPEHIPLPISSEITILSF